MNAVKGALAVLIFELGFYLIPPDNDVAFFALPVSLRIFIILALSAVLLSAMVLFLHAALAKPRSPQGTADVS